jgi:hypothetical protein
VEVEGNDFFSANLEGRKHPNWPILAVLIQGLPQCRFTRSQGKPGGVVEIIKNPTFRLGYYLS